MKFIKLTDRDGLPTYINIDTITSIGIEPEYNNSTEIWDTGGLVTKVTESIDEVMRKIEEVSENVKG